MKWAVYWQPDDLEIAFFNTESLAKEKIASLIEECEAISADMEENLDWDITLMEVKGEVHQDPTRLGPSLRLEAR